MKKIIIAALAALALISCAACASVRAADINAEFGALRAENARLSAELDAFKAAESSAAAPHVVGSVGGFYTRTGLIVNLDYNTDTVTVTDGVGLTWQFSGCDDYCIGDLVEMLFQEAGEPQYIFDDVIVSTSYSGFYAEYFRN